MESGGKKREKRGAAKRDDERRPLFAFLPLFDILFYFLYERIFTLRKWNEGEGFTESKKRLANG